MDSIASIPGQTSHEARGSNMDYEPHSTVIPLTQNNMDEHGHVGVMFDSTPNLRRNGKGRSYSNGQRYSDSDWASFVHIYADLLSRQGGKCTVKQLADAAQVSKNTAAKAIHFYSQGAIVFKQRGHGKRGVGSLKKQEK